VRRAVASARERRASIRFGRGACAVFAALIAGAAGPAPGRYDGSWALEIVTDRGGCDPLYRYYIVVNGETVRLRSMMGETAYQAAGFIQPDGSINVRVGQADDPVTIQGRLGSGSGQGTWTADARSCTGHWRAAKRQA
jgi:hypothetical protein